MESPIGFGRAGARVANTPRGRTQERNHAEIEPANLVEVVEENNVREPFQILEPCSELGQDFGYARRTGFAGGDRRSFRSLKGLWIMPMGR